MSHIVTVEAAFAQFMEDPKRKLITRSKYRYKLRPFLEQHGQSPLVDITSEHLISWFTDRERTLADATLAMVRSCLVTFFNFCQTSGWIDTNPARQLPRYDDKPQQVITANEEHMSQALTICGFLSQSTNPYHRRDAAIFALAAISGARRSNIMRMPYRETVKALARPDYDERVGNIYTVVTKGKTPVQAVFGDWHADILHRWLEVRPESDFNQLFVHLRHGSRGKPLQERGLGKARRNVCEIAGVPTITFQELRRLKGTKIARQFGLELAAEALGHVSGTRVVRNHYYNPDKRAAHVAILQTGKS